MVVVSVVKLDVAGDRILFQTLSYNHYNKKNNVSWLNIFVAVILILACVNL